MGCYDVVEVPCPQCGKEAWFQSKGGERKMANYTLENVPDGVFADINRHAPCRCTDCSTLFFVNIITRKSQIWESDYNPHDLYGENNEKM